MMEMDRDAVEIVGPERARLASLFPIGAEHEVIDDQLGAPVEEIGERKGAIRPLELVGLFHPLPGHRHSAARQRIPLAREFLLGSEQFKASLQPFLVRDHFVVEHERLLLMSAAPSFTVRNGENRGGPFDAFRLKGSTAQYDKRLVSASSNPRSERSLQRGG